MQEVLSLFLSLQWTLMSYMIEGGGSNTHSKAKRWLYRHPEASHMLLKMLTDVIVQYLLGQVAAGAQVRTPCSSHYPQMQHTYGPSITSVPCHS